MSLKLQLAKEIGTKVVATVTVAAITVGGPWVVTNLVMKSDLEDFAAMIGDELGAQIEPIARQQAVNTQAICTGRRATLKAAIRDLKVEIAQMERDEDGETWTARDAVLLAEWEEDFDEAEEELRTLNCQ